jgi:hypothetical protein
MRRAAVVLFCSLSVAAHADRLISVPTARKIPYGIVRYEFRAEPKDTGKREHLLGLGIGTSFDMELRLDQQPGEKADGTFDLAYNYIAPIQGLVPGLSMGVQDALDRTPEGRRFFGAATFRQPFSTMNGDFPADVTLGVMGEKRWTPYVGVLVPFSKEFHLLAEHDGERISAGLELRPIPEINLRFQVRGQRTLVSVQATTRF